MDSFGTPRIPIGSMLVEDTNSNGIHDLKNEKNFNNGTTNDNDIDVDNNTISTDNDQTNNGIDESLNSLLLANPDGLFSVFKQKLKSIVDLDHLSNTSINDLKLLNDEFQLLNSTNGVYIDTKIPEMLKFDINKFNSQDPILDKINRRHKQLINESDKLDNLKTEILNHTIDIQTEREYLYENLKYDNIKILNKDENSYISPLKINYIDPNKDNGNIDDASNISNQDNEDFQNENNSQSVKKKSKRGGRRVKGVTNAELLAHPELYQKKTATKKKFTRTKTANKSNLSVGATTSTVGKRRRRATTRNGEIVGVKDVDHEISEIISGQPNNKKRKVEGLPKSNNKQPDSIADEGENSIEPKLSSREIKGLEKQYDNTYLAIWKDLSRKDNPKAYRLFQQSSQAKAINLRKTAQLAARESKKWQLKTTKSQRDQLSKARRAMREMLSFWKKNEKEERALRLKAEQEALQRAKKEEEEREAKRQARKLNFLINQTELYSHFIGKKIKTGEIEGDMGDSNHPGNSNSNNNKLKESDVDLSMATKDFHNLDFDEENDENLHKMAAANAQSALLEAKEKAQQFNNGVKAMNNDDDEDDEENEGEMNFQNPTSIGNITVEQPKLLNCTLKEYQRKGLNWLANLYEQGINGILADEMGLGKTVQSISVLAYLAETHNIWGPFLVVTPASTLHNWQQEITKFVPDFNVLPYWGTSKDRKVLRKFWDRKNIIYKRNSPFHVVVTSYQLVVTDCAFFQKMKWQYMILDEAQAIKSSQSSRWKSLLSFQCRNRLLLTGTPIQNNMQELWALLHFIMPSLFDSHDEFSEWFSKDIEAHAQSNSKLNEEQLRRLHAILKPFMLRRIKKNVQSELGEKIEIDVYCDLTNRQKKLYRMLRSQINLVDLIENNKRIGNNEEVESLMNVVMQFRKVCNHPDLFERADTKSAFLFGEFPKTESLLREVNETTLELNYNTKNHIKYEIPRTLFNDLLLPSFKSDNLTDKAILINKMFNIYDPKNYFNDEQSEMNILKFVDENPNEIKKIVSQNLIINSVNNRRYNDTSKSEIKVLIEEIYGNENDIDKSLIINKKNNSISKCYTNIIDKVSKDMYMRVFKKGFYDNAVAPPIEVICSKSNFNNIKDDIFFNPIIREALLPLDLNVQANLLDLNIPLKDWPKAEMLPEEESNYFNGGTIRLPSMERFVLESAKLKKLDQMLVDLKKGGHKCLIYFQMTRMMDLMEEYLSYRQYKYIRLDGSSRLSDRRDLVNDWQTNDELFIFLLSTRAGGLGINLTAADTVIFYDSDWNPTIDSQAMDRAHRLGQQRQVTVYRLLVRGTIEERMRDRAKQKEHVQQVVMEGKVDEVNENKEKEKERDKKEMALWLLEDDK